ncbi:hypothetical protein P691DRAFT_830943 [Macrolepiota fuliginosa MF-IS2]|uniref:Uncharacterized protein n=1 Tax=Macrolepiota fuliginosa MF-IS2 TaxID=1400762 RepID=A0A9P5X6W8_9AGAR|nr:hypothetical protein P691DRAFT_830943 [Macrolepiota fuliginosa MF-IS2]
MSYFSKSSSGKGGCGNQGLMTQRFLLFESLLVGWYHCGRKIIAKNRHINLHGLHKGRSAYMPWWALGVTGKKKEEFPGGWKPVRSTPSQVMDWVYEDAYSTDVEHPSAYQDHERQEFKIFCLVGEPAGCGKRERSRSWDRWNKAEYRIYSLKFCWREVRAQTTTERLEYSASQYHESFDSPLGREPWYLVSLLHEKGMPPAMQSPQTALVPKKCPPNSTLGRPISHGCRDLSSHEVLSPPKGDLDDRMLQKAPMKDQNQTMYLGASPEGLSGSRTICWAVMVERSEDIPV